MNPNAENAKANAKDAIRQSPSKPDPLKLQPADQDLKHLSCRDLIRNREFLKGIFARVLIMRRSVAKLVPSYISESQCDEFGIRAQQACFTKSQESAPQAHRLLILV